jgi:hypothetical protein
MRDQYGPFAPQLPVLTCDIELYQIPSCRFGGEIYALAFKSVLRRVDISTISLYGKVLDYYFTYFPHINSYIRDIGLLIHPQVSIAGYLMHSELISQR